MNNCLRNDLPDNSKAVGLTIFEVEQAVKHSPLHDYSNKKRPGMGKFYEGLNRTQIMK